MSTRKARLFSAVLPFLTAGSLGAATINWGAATGITGDSDVSTDGTLVRAYNFGVDGGTDPTPTTTILNGVAFTNFTTTVTTNPSHSVGATHTIIPKAGGSSNVIAFAVGRSGSGTPYTGLTTAYQSFLSTVLYAGGAAAAGGRARNSRTRCRADLAQLSSSQSTPSPSIGGGDVVSRSGSTGSSSV